MRDVLLQKQKVLYPGDLDFFHKCRKKRINQLEQDNFFSIESEDLLEILIFTLEANISCKHELENSFSWQN
jgi:hypothetical protein